MCFFKDSAQRLKRKVTGEKIFANLLKDFIQFLYRTLKTQY